MAQQFTQVDGTVTVKGETREARQGTDGIMRYRSGGRWVKVISDRMALTFVKTPAEVTPVKVPAIGSEVRCEEAAPGNTGRVVALDGHELGLNMKPGEVLVTWKGAGSQVIRADRLTVTWSAEQPAKADENTVTIPGTVKRYGRTVPAQRIRTGDVYGPVQYRDGQDWRDAGKGVAATFQRTMTGEAPAPQVTFTMAESGVAKIAAKTGATPAKVRAAAKRQGVKVVPTIETPRPHAERKAPEVVSSATLNFLALADACKAAGKDKAAAFWNLKARNARTIARATRKASA